MKSSRLLGVIAAGLLVSNLLLLILLLRQPGGHGRPGGPRNIIIERLGFDEDQVIRYDQLIQWHRGQISAKDREIMQLKNGLYRSLNGGPGIPRRDSLLAELGRRQMEIEQIHLKHFADIRGLCREDQLQKYQLLTADIAGLFAPPHKRKRP